MAKTKKAPWPLKPCRPARREDGTLYCQTHSHSPYYAFASFNLKEQLVGWDLPPAGTLCTQAEYITEIATAAVKEYIDAHA